MICPNCGVEFEKVGKRVYCSLSCRKDAYAKKRSEDPSQKEKTREFAAKRREVLAAMKLEAGCAICGYNKFAGALHFNHRDPSTKSFSISQDPKRSWKLTLEEVEKCDVLCANCHAEVTYKNNHHKKGVKCSSM